MRRWTISPSAPAKSASAARFPALPFHAALAASVILGMLVLVIIVDEANAVLRRWLASAQA